jgi:TonB family protein
MLVFNSHMFFLRVFVSLVLASSALGQSTAPNESELSTLADRLAHEIELPGKRAPSLKILVLDFPNQRGMANVLGERMSERLADLLSERLGAEHVVAQKQFRAALLSAGISPFDMQNNDVAFWNAKKAGANLIVFGQLHSSATETTLTVQLVRVSDKKELSTASTDLTLTEETRSLIDKFPAWRFDPAVLVPCLVSTGDAVVALYKTAGVSQPKCIHCPQPPYTDEARKAHQQGAVKFDAIIDEQGRVSAATLIQGDDYGLATQAMSALKNWRFEPAAKDEKPVRVCIQIETTFHLY